MIMWCAHHLLCAIRLNWIKKTKKKLDVKSIKKNLLFVHYPLDDIVMYIIGITYCWIEYFKSSMTVQFYCVI